MLQLFDIKKGDKFSFTITFKNLTEDLTTLDFGVKLNYPDTTRLITKSLGNGVTKIDTGKYEVDLSSAETDSLSPNLYVYDLRLSLEDIVYTPLYGFLNIQETVFD
mgnify:CR=1 FL=1